MGLKLMGITKEDFEKFAFEDLSREVIWFPRIRIISNVTGSPTYTNSVGVKIRGIFTKKRTRHAWDKEGMLELGDAFLQVKEEVEIRRDDLISTDDEIFRVDEVLLRAPGGDRFFKSVVLFKVDNE